MLPRNARSSSGASVHHLSIHRAMYISREEYAESHGLSGFIPCHASKSSVLLTVAAIDEMPGHFAVSRQPFNTGASRRRHAKVPINTNHVLCKPHALHIEGECTVRPDVVPTKRRIARTEGQRCLGSGTSGESKL